MDIHSEKILILDFGSQYTQLIARRVREAHVYCELHPFDMNIDAIREYAPKGIILSGPNRFMTKERLLLKRPFLNWAFRSLASATACSLWPVTSVDRWCRQASGNTVLPTW